MTRQTRNRFGRTLVTAVVALGLVPLAAPRATATTTTFTGFVDAGGALRKAHTISVTTAGAIDGSLDWNVPSANLNLLLYDPAGVMVATATSTTSRPETITFTATTTGTWKLVVKAKSGAATYTLTANYPGGGGGGSIAQYSSSFGYKGSAGEYSYGMDYDRTDDTILVGDVWNYRIKRYTTGGQFLGVVSRGADRGQLGGTGAPFDVEADPQGDVWSADQSNSRIVEFSHNGTWKQTIGMGGGPEAWKNYPQGCGGGKMFIPTHILVHPVTGSAFDNFIYVSDVRCRDVYVFDHQGRFQFDFDWDLGSRGVFTPIPRGIDFDEGLIYVVEHNSRCIVVFDEAGNQLAIAACRSDMNDPRGLDIDRANDRLYVVAALRNEAFRFTINGTSVAFSTKWDHWGSEQLDSIRWPAVDDDGNIYIGDTWRHVVRKFAPNLNPLPWAKPPQPPPDGGWNQVNGIGIDQRPGRPTTGWLYGIDHFGNRAQAFETFGNDPGTGQPWRCPFEQNCGAFLFAFGGRESVGQNSTGFTNPTALSVGDGYVWADGGHAVIRFDLNGNFVSRFGSHGQGLGQFGNGPLGIRVIADGNQNTEDGLVYTTDATMCRVQVFDYDGTLVTHSGSQGCGNSTISQMAGPRQLDVRGDLVYVADAGRNRIAVWDTTTTPMTFVGAITATYGTQKVSGPRGVLLDPASDWLYIGDTNGRRVVRIDVGASGQTFTNPQVVTTGADTPEGSFKAPEWMEFGPDGRLFVSDNNQVVYAYTITG
jgi:6-phosphogluconolactonase (cycloisomerase 2 family)